MNEMLNLVWQTINDMDPAARAGLLGAVVGGIVNAVKRWPRLPSWAIPAVALLLALGLTWGHYALQNLDPRGALNLAIASLLAGSLPIAGHRLLKQIMGKLGASEEQLDRWLGQADGKKDSPPAATPRAGGGSSAVMLLMVCLVPPLTAGCGASLARVTERALETAARSNNALVAALDEVQEKARSGRRNILEAIALGAPSRAAAEAAMVRVEERYAPVWEAMKAAEGAQAVLGEAIEAARAALDLGRSPNVDSVLRLYAELQRAQTTVSKALARVPADD